MHLSIFAIFSVGCNDVVLVVVSYFHTAGFLVEVLGVAEVLLAWFLRTNFKFGERGWGVVIVVGADAWDNLGGRVDGRLSALELEQQALVSAQEAVGEAKTWQAVELSALAWLSS